MELSSKSSSLRLAIILLAAGEGSRMGSIPKGLLRKDGESLLERFCVGAHSLDPVEFLVITGFHAQVIEKEIAKKIDAPIGVIRNPNADKGQGSSVRLALESLQSEFDVLAVCLCDQPNVGGEELKALLEQFATRQHSQEVVMPIVKGQRGNPVLFSRKAVEDILSTPGMVCRSYMDQYPELVRTFETSNAAYILDVDTEADIQKLGVTRP